MQAARLPMECKNLNEIRQGIDAIDREIIRLLQQRMGYVLSAAQFKPDETSISAPDRVVAMLIDRRHWAEEEKLCADYIELLFTDIIRWFINQQTLHWRKTYRASMGEDV
ncbi:isochorismate lyase [Microbulbifer sp. 2304DJ12-6]|uniref:isochorismate lyase n=1 Tax=Microbulbifer sp. 2304DJ12-6 TaxID=3233340 RepID=UPI00260D48FB|nr:isochorismate lyase [uncultured Microbulbifer sp.]